MQSGAIFQKDFQKLLNFSLIWHIIIATELPVGSSFQGPGRGLWFPASLLLLQMSVFFFAEILKFKKQNNQQIAEDNLLWMFISPFGIFVIMMK